MTGAGTGTGLNGVRAELASFLEALLEAPDDALDALAAERIAEGAVWHVCRPIERLEGRAAILDGLIRPLRRALPNGLRRDEILIAGSTRIGEGDWVATLGHTVGNFEAPLGGVAPSGKLVFLRAGEMYRVEGGRIVEARILIDFIDLARQAGRAPLPALLGTEMLFPGPATHDGVRPDAPERSEGSALLVEAMLGDLRAFDPESFESRGQTGYWHPQMLWYGPAGIGANFTYKGFQRDHRIPFLTAFPDRVGGNHFCRFGDGDYVCSGGWPSMTMTHLGPYLGVAPTGRPLTLRVMDFWRCRDGTIRENWVLLDYLDLFAQMGAEPALIGCGGRRAAGSRPNLRLGRTATGPVEPSPNSWTGCGMARNSTCVDLPEDALAVRDPRRGEARVANERADLARRRGAGVPRESH